MKKKFLLALMLIALTIVAFGAISASAETEGIYTYTVSSGIAIITDCDTLANGEIAIPDTLGGYPVTSIGNRAFYVCRSIRSITIPESVTNISDYAFSGCSSLENITIGDSVTSIGNYVFSYCSSLTSIEIPESVSRIGTYAFCDCNSLDNIIVDENNPNYSSIDGVLFSKNKTNLIRYPACKTNIEYIIPDSVTSIGDYAFDNCRILTSVTIPNSVKSIGRGTFYDCSSLTTITIPENATIIGDSSFYKCTALTRIYWNAKNIANFSSDNYVFAYAGQNGDGINVVFGDEVESIPKYCFYPYSSNEFGNNKYSPKVTSITIGDNVTIIGDYAFADCEYLTSVTIGDDVTTIGDWAFEACESLESITISEGVTCIGSGAFSGCIGLESITISAGVTSINDWTFHYCKSLESIALPDSVISIGDSAFESCESLESITISDGVKSIGDAAFFGCTSLGSIALPESVTSVGNYAFADCASLESITIPDSVTTIGECAFTHCTNLESIIVDDNPNYCSIDGVLFAKNKTALIQYPAGKTNIEYIIPNSVATIGDSAFESCESLESITIPDSVTTIGDYAFYSCTSFATVYFNGNQNGWDQIEIGSGNQKLINAKRNYFFYVTLIDKDGNEINTKNYDANELINISDIEEKIEHTIHFFTDEECKNKFDLTKPITENLVLQLRYIPNQYLSKFVDYDGELIWEGLIDYGAVITPPENPERERTQQYTYTFAGWEGFTEGITQENHEMVFTATYNATINQYTYKFLNADGKALKVATVDYGTVIEIPVNPTKESTAQYTYTFTGWDGYTSGMTIEGDITFTATYTETVNQHTYKFVDDNGYVLKEETVDYGMVIVAPENPADKDAYTFDYWEGFVDGMTVAGDITFKAVYKYKMYNVSVFGYEDLKSEVIYNRNYTITPAEKYGYEFLGYYSAENGNGTKFTDEKGNSFEVYNIEDDSVVYPYFKDLLCNKVVVSGTDTVMIGDADVRYTVSLGTDKTDIYYTTIKVKYPKALILEDVVNNKFDETEIIEIIEHEDYNFAEILCVYSYDGNAIPTLTPIDVFELLFDVDKTSKVQDVTVEITDDSILMGEVEDYPFDSFVNVSISIEPKLTESITIDGLSQIDAPTQYTATVYPDYTTDKAVVWSVSDENIATISEGGILTPVKNGTVTVTATANDGSGVLATKTVDVIAYAQITSLDFGSGVVLAGFNPNVRNYTVYVNDNANSIILTPKYSKGTLKANSDISLLSGRAKEFELNDVITTITLNRENVTDMTNSIYTIEIIKFEGTKTEVSEDKKSFTIKPINVENGKTVILALYNGEQFVEMQSVVYAGEAIPFITTKEYTKAKVMVWDNLTNLKPIYDVEFVK